MEIYIYIYCCVSGLCFFVFFEGVNDLDTMVLGMAWAFIRHEHSSGQGGGVMSNYVQFGICDPDVRRCQQHDYETLWNLKTRTKWTKASRSVSMHNTSPQHGKEIHLEPCNSEYARLPTSIHLQPWHSFAHLLGSWEHRTFVDRSDFPILRVG